MPDTCVAYGCSITAEPQKGIGLKKNFHSGMIRALKVTREDGFDSRKTLSPFLFTQAARTKERTSRYVTLPW